MKAVLLVLASLMIGGAFAACPSGQCECNCPSNGCMGSIFIEGPDYENCCDTQSDCQASDTTQSCSASAYTDVLDFRTASGTAYWQNAVLSNYWTCADSWCQGVLFTRTPPSQEAIITSVYNANLDYSGHKYYMRATFTDKAGATATNAVEIRLVTGSSTVPRHLALLPLTLK
jgi:hypothetical protein